MLRVGRSRRKLVDQTDAKMVSRLELQSHSAVGRRSACIGGTAIIDSRSAGTNFVDPGVG